MNISPTEYLTKRESTLTILVVSDFAHVNGGAAQAAITSAVALSKRGHHVILFAAVGPVSEELVDSGVEVILTNQHDIASDSSRVRAVAQGLWNGKASRLIGSVLDRCERRLTAVHLHAWSHALSSSVVRECVNRKFRIIATLHDYFMACPNGGFFNFQTERICTLRPLSLECVAEHCDARSALQKQWRVLRQIVQTRFGLIPSGIQDFIFVSDFSRRIMQPYLPAGARQHEVSNLIEVPRREPAEISEASSFMYVGTLVPHKGVRLLAEAAAGIATPVAFAGDGQCKEDIRKVAHSAKLLGWLPKTALYSELARSRALIFPSLWYEAQPLVVLEAAAIGLPAVVSDTSAARDMVENGVNGYWFKGGSRESLREKMQLLEDTALARKMGRAAYDRYWSEFPTADRQVDQLEECYRSMLERPW